MENKIPNLLRIKEEVESKFNCQLSIEKFRDKDELVFKGKKDTVYIYVSRYTCLDSRLGKEFIGFDFWNGNSGLGSPCDSMEELFENLDKIKMPRRAVPKEITEQLSLF